MIQDESRHGRKPFAIKSVATYAMAAVILLAVSAHQPASARLKLQLSYRIRVDAADLSGLTVEMRVRGAVGAVSIAMASHPEYDDRYWRYVENLTAESQSVKLTVTRLMADGRLTT